MRWKRAAAWLMIIIFLLQCLAGCGPEQDASSESIYIPEQKITESYIDAETLSENNITEELILENLVYEDCSYELTISEDFFCEAYIIETVIGSNTIEDLKKQLPADFDHYDIDWPKVIGKFAVGTAVIITVGIVHHYTKGATYFIFSSPGKVAADALISGAMKAALDVVIRCRAGNLPEAAVRKYALEGFADGFMWGAVCSVGKTVLHNLKLPAVLRLKDGSKLKIRMDGSVVNSAGEAIGKAYACPEGIFIKNAAEDSIPYVFNTRGKQIVDLSSGLLKQVLDNRLPENAILQVGFADSAQTVKTDAAGTVFEVNGKLLPNISYRLSNCTYETDSLGRIVKVTFQELTLRERMGRLPIVNTLQEIGRGFQKAGDDRGHLIGDRFNGDNSLANIVPMDKELNQGAYKAMEDTWAEAIQKGGSVSGTIELVYKGSSFRPESLRVVYSIGKKMVTRLFSNI